MHREHFNNVSNDIDTQAASCHCGCGHDPKVEAIVTVAKINGGLTIYSANPETDAAAVLAEARDALTERATA